jgi:hypothetical protein
MRMLTALRARLRQLEPVLSRLQREEDEAYRRWQRARYEADDMIVIHGSDPGAFGPDSPITAARTRADARYREMAAAISARERFQQTGGH